MFAGARITSNINSGGTVLTISSDGTGEVIGNISTGGWKVELLGLKKYTGHISDAGQNALIKSVVEFDGTIAWRPGESGTIMDCKKVTFRDNGNIMMGLLYLVNIDRCICEQIGKGGYPLSINSRRVNFEYSDDVLKDCRYENNFFFDCNFKQLVSGKKFIADHGNTGSQGFKKATFNCCNFFTDCPAIMYPEGNTIELDFIRTNYSPLYEMGWNGYSTSGLTIKQNYNITDSDYTVGY